MLLSICS
ncbi:hypothetical protein D043_1887A, partial [Vibrio parahaemolyticus EKP-021]